MYALGATRTNTQREQSQSHYNPEHALDPEVLVNGERAHLLAEVTRLLQAAPAATKPKGPAP